MFTASCVVPRELLHGGQNSRMCLKDLKVIYDNIDLLGYDVVLTNEK